MVKDQFPLIDAEYCIAEGGGVVRIGGEVKYATVQTLEKIPRGIELVARGISGHGSVPLKSNAIVHLAGAVAKVGDWRPEIRFNETTGSYFRKLASVSPPEVAKIYRDVLSTDPKVRAAADDWLLENEPRHSSMLRTSVSPNIFTGGYRSNVIPSEAKATLDVRALPDEDPAKFLEQVKQVVNDPAVEVRFTGAERAAGGADAAAGQRVFKALEAAATRVYNAITLPTMSTGATDMAQLRAKGVQCFGIGSATDFEDPPKGFGAHSDQERMLESELHRFVRFNWEAIVEWHGRDESGGLRSAGFRAASGCPAPCRAALRAVTLCRRGRPCCRSGDPSRRRRPTRLEGARRRDDAALPGGAAARHHQPARERAPRRRVPEAGVRPGGRAEPGLRARREPPEHRRAAEGQRQEAAAAHHGAHRHRHRRRGQVEAPAVQRDARRRLRLCPRRGRRQGQPRRRR